MAEAILQLEQVTKRFERTLAADRLSLTVYRGEFFTFLGPSGSGKSTILRMIAGLEQPDAGGILIAGRDVGGVPPWRRNLGMVFQQYAIFSHMTVAQNVSYGLRVRRRPSAEIGEKVGRLLTLVGLAGMAEKNVTLLSGGEQQRVALARALVLEPSLLLLDEPLSALDEKIRREMQAELKHIQQKTGTTFVYVTHDQEEALTMSDRIAVLDSGACVQCDAPERLFRRPRTRFVAGFFRGCNILAADLVGREAGRAQFEPSGGGEWQGELQPEVRAEPCRREPTARQGPSGSRRVDESEKSEAASPPRGEARWPFEPSGAGEAIASPPRGEARVELRIGGHVVSVPLDGVTLPDRPRLNVALRAEHVRVGRGAEACETRIEATLIEVIYRGTNVDHVLELPDGQRVVATSTQREAGGAGRPVACGFNAEDVILLED